MPSPGYRVAGVDVGGTKTALGVLSQDGFALVDRWATPASSCEDLLEELVRRLDAAGRFDAVAIVVPGVVDARQGVVCASTNLPLAGVALRDECARRLGVPVVIENDARAAAFAEAHVGTSLVHPDLVLLTIGTGVGCGIVLGGQLRHGATGAAGEVSQMLVAADLSVSGDVVTPRQDGPLPGSVEAIASGRALDRLARAAGIEAGPALATAAAAGHRGALACLRVFGERLGVVVANLVHLLEPELMLIGGGVSEAGDALLIPVRQAVRRLLVPGVGGRTSIEIARHGSDAGARGAALFAREALPSTAAPD